MASAPKPTVTLNPQALGEYQAYAFHRGWLLSRESAPPCLPDNWQQQTLGINRLWLSPAINAEQCANVWVLGWVFDVRDPKLSNRQVAENLAEAWGDSATAFMAQLAHCNGSFTVLAEREGAVSIYCDATAMAPVFYHSGLQVAGSHSALVAASAAGSDTIATLPLYAKFGSPGRLTPYRDVYSLNPGLTLHLSRGLERVRFLQAPPDIPYEAVLEEFSQLLQNSMQAFALRKKLVLSLTAGSDSRTALAAARGLKGIEYFTYYRSDSVDTDKVDKVIAERIAREHKLEHSLLMLREQASPEAYKKLCKLNSHYSHIPVASYHYFLRWGEQDVFHVRSNLSEIGRAFYSYRMPGPDPRPANAETALGCYLSDKMRNSKQFGPKVEQAYQSAFDDYAVSSQLPDIHPNYDYRDIFYWEHRMGVWHSQVVAESSPAFESLSVYNCDRILQLMLMPDFKQRQTKQLMLHSISKNWPKLLDVPVNPKEV
ncbi:hypothetical protein [Gilvimarinus xylanilyticus]|uniref:Asparagine synthetase domain-containing protein n=1 Tax=Gilvimarinus xylanilyticus TaxID=2944139 RepID=A0A9X2I5G2_9GAMM|nr:hypothetical protein [Gilvimarinus xylanilyticus]MCP8900276.1 hypothetical protein [Gilvimarinus xylanilyticus]